MAKLSKEEAEKLKVQKQEELAKSKMEKERVERRKKRQKTEQKRVNTLVGFPMKILFNTSILVGLISFIYLYFYIEIDLNKTIISVFFIFTSIYLCGGVIASFYYYFMSEEKRKELNEKLKMEAENKQNEEKRRQQQEMEELEAIERELLEKRTIKKEQPEISSQVQMNQQNSNVNLDGNMINNESDQNLAGLNNMPDNEQNFDESYFAELLGPEFSEKSK
jgi:hypothetical protein